MLAVDAADSAGLWDVAAWRQLGVASRRARGWRSDREARAAPLRWRLCHRARRGDGDGMLLTAEGQALRLLRDPTGQRPARDIPLLGADGTSALGVSADGKTLFRSTPEGDVELVRLDGTPTSRFHAHDGRIVAMAVTSDLHVLTAAQTGR